ARHLAISETVLAYAVGHVGDLLTDTAKAEQAAAAEGTAGTTPFDLAGDGGVVSDPPPLGYRLAGVRPALHFQVVGVAVAHDVVSMAQSAQPVIPHLFDPAADDTVVPGLRLFTLPTPGVVATVQEFAPVVTGSHDPTFEARVLVDFQTGDDPDGITIP